MKSCLAASSRIWRFLCRAGWVTLLVACSAQPEPEALWPATEDRIQQRSVPTSAGVIEELLTTAEQHRAQEDWQALIDVAEQGIRINRRLPQWYLLLAESYLALAQPGQARHFIEQGRRYCHADSFVCSQMVQLSKTLHIER